MANIPEPLFFVLCILTGIPAYLKILASNETILLKHELKENIDKSDSKV